ncbi:hypothetical protein Q5752_004239 [Cryptotrichosporon argae]
MLGFACRLFSTSSARASGTAFSAEARAAADASALVPHRAEAPFVNAAHIPPVLYRHIQRQLAARGTADIGSPVQIRNPFLRPRNANLTTPPPISSRRQAQLAQVYGADLLPSLTVSGSTPAAAAPVKWFDGTLVSWSGTVLARTPTSVYGTRKRMFKGHRAERERKGRDEDRRERLDGMERRIADWKRATADAREKERPSLPF